MPFAKPQGNGGDKGGRLKSDEPQFLQHLLTTLNNTSSPPGKVETLTTDHGGEVLSNTFKIWLKTAGVFHMTAAAKEPKYNDVI